MRPLSLILTCLALGWLIAGCGAEDDETFPGSDESGTERPIGEATVEQILQNTEEYMGTTVIVRGATVEAIDADNAFVLRGDEAGLLVSAPSGTPTLEPGDSAGVRVEVTRFTGPLEGVLESEVQADEISGLQDVPTERGDPYLLLRATTETQTGAEADASSEAILAEERAALAEVVGSPEYGLRVEVAGRVTDAEERAFVLEARGDRLLVVPQFDPERNVDVGDVVRARGVVEKISGDGDPAIVTETRLFDEFEGEPTLAADEFTIVEQ